MNSNPFLSIWFRPRETVRQLVSETPDLHVYLLAALWGIEKGLAVRHSEALAINSQCQ